MNQKFFTMVWGVLLLGTVALVVVSESVTPEIRDSLFKEGAVIETLSAVGYFAAAALLLLQAIMRMPARWSAFLMVLCFGMRELDFDKRFTTMGLFKSRIYSSSEVPIHEKLLAVLVTVLLLTCVYFLIKNYFRPFLQGIRRRDGMALSVFFFGGALVLSKSLDGIARKLKPLGIETSEFVSRLSSGIEETLELAASLLLLVVVVVAFRQPKQDPAITE